MDLNPDRAQKVNPGLTDYQREKQESLSLNAKKKVQFARNLSYWLAVIIAFAVVLSLPFPFVRRNWMRELWGYYGLMNAAYFFVIASRLNHRNLALPVTALGILFYDQIRTWHSFIYYFSQKGSDFRIDVYLVVSILLASFIFVVFISVIKCITQYQLFKRDELKLYSTSKETKAVSFKPVLFSLLFYFLINFTAQHAALLEPRTAYGTLRILGSIGCAGSFYLIGKILELYLKNKDFKKHAVLGIIFHIIFLIFTQWSTTALMPISLIIQ